MVAAGDAYWHATQCSSFHIIHVVSCTLMEPSVHQLWNSQQRLWPTPAAFHGRPIVFPASAGWHECFAALRFPFAVLFPSQCEVSVAADLQRRESEQRVQRTPPQRSRTPPTLPTIQTRSMWPALTEAPSVSVRAARPRSCRSSQPSRIASLLPPIPGAITSMQQNGS